MSRQPPRPKSPLQIKGPPGAVFTDPAGHPYVHPTVADTRAAIGAGAGDVVGPAASVDGEVALYSGITGKLLKRATGTGIVRVTSGVYGTPGNVVESEITLADNTTHNVSTSKHGFAPKGDGDTTKFLNADGTYSTPSGSGGGGSGTVTNTGALTSGKLIQGTGGVDVSVNATTAAVVKLTSGTPSAATAGTDYVAPGAVTTSGLTQATSRLLGRTTASTGAVEEISVGSGLSLAAGALTATGGGLVLLEQHTASASATLDFTTWYSSSYDEYRIEFVGIRPATDNVNMFLRWSTNGGSSYDSSAIYDQAFYYIATGLAASNGSATNASSAELGGNIDNDATGGYVATLTLFDPGSTTRYKVMNGLTAFQHSSVGYIQFWRTWIYKNATAVNAFQIQMTSGNLASGTVRVYGLAK